MSDTDSKIVTIVHRRGDRVVEQFEAEAVTIGRVTKIVFPTYLTVLWGDEVHIT